MMEERNALKSIHSQVSNLFRYADIQKMLAWRNCKGGKELCATKHFLLVMWKRENPYRELKLDSGTSMVISHSSISVETSSLGPEREGKPNTCPDAPHNRIESFMAP